MEFKSLKNIESSFRQIRLFGIVFLSLCAVITVWSVWSSYRFAERQREKIYVLDNGKSLMLALSQDLSQNRPAEAREHVRRFHELFFTLSPEKSAIEHNVKRALLLADKSVNAVCLHEVLSTPHIEMTSIKRIYSTCFSIIIKKNVCTQTFNSVSKFFCRHNISAFSFLSFSVSSLVGLPISFPFTSYL